MRIARRTGVVAVALLGAGLFLAAGPALPLRAEVRAGVAGLPGGKSHDWQPAKASGPVDGVPLRNFGVVCPGCLYRSAQPGDDADYAWLVDQGFKSIICLRGEHDCSDRAALLKAKGIAYLHLRIRDEDAPTDAQAREFLAFVRDPFHWPALVHCKDGIGRASTMAALARYAIDGWSMSAALHEARQYRPFRFRMYGKQRRWLNHWKDRFAAGEYRPAAPAKPVTTATGG